MAYLMRKQGKPYEEVLAQVKEQRPVVNPRPQFEIQLKIWERTGYKIWEDDEKIIPKAEYKEYLERREVYLKGEEEQAGIEINLKTHARFGRKRGVK